MNADRIADGLKARRSGSGWVAKCPAHEDSNPSLSIGEKDGKVLVHCHAGCSQRDLIEALCARGLWVRQERRQWTLAERREWARQRRQLDRHLPAAHLWRRAAVALGDEILDQLKASLTDPTLPPPPVGEISRWTALLAAWLRLDDAALVAVYLGWVRQEPQLTAAMVYAAKLREIAEDRALRRYLGMSRPVAGI